MVDTCPTRAGATAVQSAVLPFVIPWQALDPAFEVVTLAAAGSASQTQDRVPFTDGAQGWDRLLAGLGIALRVLDQTDPAPLPSAATVISGFDLLDCLSGPELDDWIPRARAALRPGGLLILGGHYRHAARTRRILDQLGQAGFARSRMILPPPPASESPLVAALSSTGQRYAVLAQAPAQGKAFDVFSPAFLAAPACPITARLAAAEAAAKAAAQDHLHHQVHTLHDRITHLDSHANGRLDALTSALEQSRQTQAAQRHQIVALQETVARLERLTRRRGLRKLAYRIKQKWRGAEAGGPAPPRPAQPAAQAPSPPAPAPSADALPAAHPVPSSPAPDGLSLAETQVYARLFDRSPDPDHG